MSGSEPHDLIPIGSLLQTLQYVSPLFLNDVKEVTPAPLLLKTAAQAYFPTKKTNPGKTVLRVSA